MFKGLLDTVNPKGGHGVVESVVVVLIVGAVLYMGIRGIEIPPIISNAFTAVIAFIVGTNSRSQWSEEKRAEKLDNDGESDGE